MSASSNAAPAAPAPVAARTPGPRFPELDGLRGFAALGIAIYHYLGGPASHLPLLHRFLKFLELSPLSLDLFFVLSGFLIGGILLRSRQAPDYYKTFYRRRFYRILPLYYVWIAFFCILYFVAQGWGLTPPAWHSGVLYLASYVFLFQNFFPAIIRSTYMVQPTWTLVVEEHFYVLAPLCVRRLTLRGLVKVLLAVILLAPLFRAVLFRYLGNRSEWSDIASRIWPPCRADALALGVLLAVVWATPEFRTWIHKRISVFVWGMIGTTAAAVLLDWMAREDLHHSRSLNVALGRSAVELACFCLIVCLISRPQSAFARWLSTDTMRGLGQISYCIYVVHWGILWMIFRFVLHMRFGERLWVDFAVIPVALLLTILVARLSWRYLEYPLIKRAHSTPTPALATATERRQPIPVTLAPDAIRFIK